MAFSSVVGPLNFTGTAATAVESVHTSLEVRVAGSGNSSGYVTINDTGAKAWLQFSSSLRPVIRDTGTYTNDQYAKATISGLTGSSPADSGYSAHLCLQVSADTGSNADYYLLVVDNTATTTLTMYRVDNGTRGSALDSDSAAGWSNGDAITFGIESGVLKVWRNGSEVSGFTYTDGSPLTGGKPGFGVEDYRRLCWDDFEAGDITAGGGSSVGAAAYYFSQQ